MRWKFFSISRRGQAQHHRPAVRTHRGIGGAAKLFEDVHHLLVRERVIGLHGRMAGGRRRDAAQRVADVPAAIQPFQILRQRAYGGHRILAARTAGTAVTRSVSPPKSSTPKPSRVEIVRMAQQRLPPFGRQLDQHRLEQSLALESSGAQFLHHALEQHALVRDMLIDDRDAVGIHRDDERVAELAERHHGFQRSAGSGFPVPVPVPRFRFHRCTIAPAAPIAPIAPVGCPAARVDASAQHIRNRLRHRHRVAIAARQRAAARAPRLCRSHRRRHA